MPLSERLNTPISTAELERRWKAVRSGMAAAKIDVLLMQNNNDHMGGYVKYVTDLPAVSIWDVAILPDGSMLRVATHGRGFYEPQVAGSQWRYGAVGNARWTGVRLAEESGEYGGAGVLVTGSVVTAGDARLLLTGRDVLAHCSPALARAAEGTPHAFTPELSAGRRRR